jgi:hypothetical protein
MHLMNHKSLKQKNNLKEKFCDFQKYMFSFWMIFIAFIISFGSVKASMDDQTFFRVIDAQMRVLANNRDTGITLEDAMDPEKMASFFKRMDRIADQIMDASAQVIAGAKTAEKNDTPAEKTFTPQPEVNNPQEERSTTSPLETKSQSVSEPLTPKQQEAVRELVEHASNPLGNVFDGDDALLEEAFAELANQSLPILQKAQHQKKDEQTPWIKPPSPTDTDTTFEQAKQWVKDKTSSVIPEQWKADIQGGMHALNRATDAYKEDSKNTTLETISQEMDAFTHLGRLSGVIETGTEYTKAFTRRGLRGLGVDAKTAQDIASVAEIATYLTPAVSRGASAASQTLKKVGQEVSAAARFSGDVMAEMISGGIHPKPTFAYVNGRGRSFEQSSSFHRRAFSSADVGQSNVFRNDAPTAKKGPVVETPSTRSEVNSVRADSLPPAAQTTREKLFGTNEVKGFSDQRVRPISGQLPDNYALAGKTYNFENVKDIALRNELRQKYPHGVPFSGTGFPDFSRYAEKKVRINMTGENYKDFRTANKAVGLSETPAGYTWHHHFDGETMHLIPRDIHARSAVPHTGGAAIVKGKK